MANVIIKNENRKADAEHIMKTYGVEAAEIAAARTNEAVRMSQNRRRYF